MSDHVYEYPDSPSRPRAVLRDREDGFGGIRPGVMWCWAHGSWEDIPQEWRDEEKRLGERISRGWKARQFTQGKLTFPEGFEQDVRSYCALTSWKMPDLDASLWSFVKSIEEPYWIKGKK